MKHHEIFYARTQQELTTKNFAPTEQQLSFARKSLIEKHKISNGIQQLLFCKRGNQEQEEFLSMNDRNIIQNERKKYIEFIRRNYNQKISEELFNINKLKNRIREVQERERAEKQRQDDLMAGKRAARVAVKRKTQEKPTAGKKKVKTEVKETAEKPAPKGKKTQPNKKQPQNVPDVVPQPLEEFQEQPSPDQSLSLNLINSLSEDQYQNDYE